MNALLLSSPPPLCVSLGFQHPTDPPLRVPNCALRSSWIRRLALSPAANPRSELPLGRVESMYIRVKRNKSTYFIQCDPTETVLNIKQKVHSIIDQPPNKQRLILLDNNNILNDSKTLADEKVENDAIVALVLRKDNGFEEVSIADPNDFMSSS